MATTDAESNTAPSELLIIDANSVPWRWRLTDTSSCAELQVGPVNWNAHSQLSGGPPPLTDGSSARKNSVRSATSAPM